MTGMPKGIGCRATVPASPQAGTRSKRKGTIRPQAHELASACQCRRASWETACTVRRERELWLSLLRPFKLKAGSRLDAASRAAFNPQVGSEHSGTVPKSSQCVAENGARVTECPLTSHLFPRAPPGGVDRT